MNNHKLNARNGDFGDTPAINPALETPPKTANTITKLQRQLAEAEERNRTLLNELYQRLEAEKAFGFIAGKYEQDNEPNIKISRGNLTLDEALALQMEHTDAPFAYIQYKGLSIIAMQGILEQAA